MGAVARVEASAGRLAGPPLIGASIDLWNPHGFAVMMALFPMVYLAVAAVTWTSTNPPHKSTYRTGGQRAVRFASERPKPIARMD